MAWNVVHNFPGAKDTYQVPTNYPDAGFDTIIALWFTDIFTSIFAIMDALGYDITGAYDTLNERISGGIYRPRIVGNATDFQDDDFTVDGNVHKLDLSAIIPVGTKAVVVAGEFFTAVEPGAMILSAGDGGYGDWVAPVSYLIAEGWKTPFSCVLPVNEDREIDYLLETALTSDTGINITGYFS